MELISVIVPIYNVEPYLRKCVDSILAQTYTNLEIILVDDGSPDNCGAICDEYAQKDKRVIVIHKENGGVSTARNAGLDAATGEYIAFIDPDDYIPKDYLEILYKEITDDVDMVVCRTNVCSQNGDCIEQWPSSLESAIVLDVLDIRNFMKYNHGAVWGVLYKRSVIGDLRFNPDYYISEDTVFYYSVLKQGRKVKHTPSTGYYYVKVPHSAWGDLYDKFDERKYSMVYACQNLCQLYDNVEIKEVFECLYIQRCHLVLTVMRRKGIQDMEKIKFLKHEIRRLLPQGLRRKDFDIFLHAGFIFDAFLPEGLNMLIWKLYDFCRKNKADGQFNNRKET